MNKKLYEMNNLYNSPRLVQILALVFAMGFCSLSTAQVPTITARFANPVYDCVADQYCLDIEFQSDTPDQELFGMNVRFFYDDADMDIIDFSDFQGGYGPSGPNPGPVVMSVPGFGTDFFNFPAPGVADFVNFAFEKVDGMAPPIILETAGWTKLLQVCFTIDGPVPDSANFCPPIVWDLELDPANGGYLPGDDGVVMTVVAPMPLMSAPADENVVQFNWMYTGDGSAPPYGEPVENECIDLFCIPTIACPPDITIECNDSTDPADTGFASASDACLSDITVSYTDVVNGSGCLMTYTIERTWTAVNECGMVSEPCIQIITLNQLPTITVRFDDPSYDCLTGEYCLDVELQADMPDVELFGMNVRFFYDDSYMELIGFSDFQGGYGPVAPDPPTVLMSLPGFGTDFFGYPAPGIVDFVNGAVQLVDDMAPPLYISTTDWTKIFQVCFLIDGPVDDSMMFCPPVVWDLELDPANGGYLPGDDGVVITIVNPPPAMSGPATENVQQFNWMYTGDGSAPPYGEPTEEQCLSLVCLPDIVCPADITLNCEDSTDPADTGFASATDMCMLDITISYSDATVDGGAGCVQTYTINRTWVATNECDFTDVCVQTITVRDTMAPILVCPPFITISCDDSTDPMDTGMASATDNCSPAPVVSYIDVTVDGPCPQSYTIDRIWSGTDECGNTIFCRQEITILDTDAPAITCPVDLTLECDEPIPTDLATATDNCSLAADITVEYVDIVCDNPIMGFMDIYDFANWSIINPDGGSVTPMGTSTVMMESVDTGLPCPDGASVLFQIVIPSTGQLVFDWDFTSEDVNGPLYDPFGYNLNGTFFQLTDDNGPDHQHGTASVAVTAGDIFAFEQNSVDCILGIGATTVVEFFACIEQMEETCSQLVIRAHTATDECDNSSTCIQTIYITDTTNPGIVCPPDIVIECTESTDPANTGMASATDNCDTTPEISYSDVTLAGNCPQEYTITRTWTATDACGNTTSCVQTVTVDDSTPPTITLCPADITIECDESTDPANTGMASATDNCDPDPVVSYSDSITPGACPQEYTIIRVWTATDACGNGTACTQVITVDDSTPPVITCPAGLTIECDESIDPLNTGLATATDNCDTAPLVDYSDVTLAGACPQEYTITRTWTATDACGNTSTCDQVIVVEDTTPPTITFCPPSITIECDESTDPANTGLASATDNCDTAPVVSYSDVTVAGNCPQEYTITRTWTATDACGNGTNCIQVITVDDSVPPTITFCPPNITIECDESTDPANTGLATATDNCDPAPEVTYTDTVTPGACPQEYSILRVWNVTDACGNGTACTQVITVDDSVPPTLTCAPDVTIECDESTDPANTGISTATDNCDTAPVVSYTDAITPGACPQEYTITRTWTATDACGNGTNCIQVITVDDSTPPTITLCPADVTIECDEDTSPANTGFASATDNCDTAPIVTFSDVTLAGACPQEYTITRTWSATDACGNNSTCEQVISIEDTTPPTITFCPDDITIECDESTDPGNTGTASATDNCDTDPVVDYSDVTVAGACPQEYTITRTWTATDACGNSSTCEQVIVIDDSTPPTITCPPDMTLECTDPIPTDLATATDNCSGDLTITYSDIMCDNPVQGFNGPYDVGLWTTIIPAEGGSVTVMGDSEVMLTSPDITIGCDDASVQFSINVTSAGQIVFDWHYETQDIDGPFFDPFGYNLNGTFYQLTDDNGNDIQSGTATVAVIAGDVFAFDQRATDCIAGPGATSVVEFFACIEQDDEVCTQLIIRTHSATDECDNTSSCVQTIFFEDTVAPEITCAADVTIECDESTDPANTGLTTATDFCDPTPDISYTDVTIASQNCVQEYTIERTWTATDNCGNTTTCVQTIVVDDSTPPVITCPADAVIECDESTSPDNTGLASATDNCDTDPIVTYSDVTLAGACPQEYTITRTWIATDACGNSSTCDQTISVEDTTPPLMTCPADVVLECDESTDPVNTGMASATDNCDTAPSITYTDVTTEGACPQEYTITRTWTATDACGNGTNCIQVISVEDNTAPVFNVCPTDITIECDESTDPANTGLASATDNCGGEVTVTYNDVIEPGACPQEYTITRTWTAIDECGNETLCGFVDRLLTSEADFSGGEQLIDFDNVPFGLFNGDEYAAQGVNFFPLVANLGIFTTPVNSPPGALYNHFPTPDDPGPIRVVFDSRMNRAGFYLATNAPDDISVEVSCIANGVTIATEVFVTDPTMTFFGLESATGFDELVFEAFGPDNNFFGIDDLRFEGGCCVQTIKVEDTTVPALACPADITIECDESTDPANTGMASATDNCDTAPTITYADTATPGECDQEYTITRVWTVTDACGNGTNCTQVISVVDTTPPVIECPGTIRVECDESTDPSNTGFASATDNCDNGDNDPVNEIWINEFHYDNEGTDEGEFIEVAGPAGTDLSAYSLVLYNGSNGLVYDTDVLAGVIDDEMNGIGAVHLDYPVNGIQNGSPDGIALVKNGSDVLYFLSYEGTFSAVDGPAAGMMSVDVGVSEGGATPVGASLALLGMGNQYADFSWVAVAAGSPGTLNINQTTTPLPMAGPDLTYVDVTFEGPCPQEYDIQRTWTATDDCGNTATCTQLIIVEDTTPPVFTECPPSVIIECDESTDPADLGVASATDNCGPVESITYSDLAIEGACPQEMTITRTWVATDACGNTSECEQIIIVEDSTPPVIECPEDLTLECDEVVPTDLATATDNCSATIEFTYSDVMCTNPVMGFTDIYDFSNWTTIIPPEGGSVTTMSDTEIMMVSPDDLTLSCDDAAVQFQIVIPSTGQLVFDWHYETDDVDGPEYDPFGYNLNGTFYQLTDDDGLNIQSGTATVVVTAGDVFAFEQQSEDCVLGAGASTVIEFFACIEEDADVCTMLIIRTHTATDECDNEASCIQTIYIEDSVPPTITFCPVDVTIECDESTLPDNTGLATATDNCLTEPVVTYNDVTVGSQICDANYTITRTWTATDYCGNTTTCVQVIDVADTTPPALTCPADLTIECDESTDPVNTGSASATDNCTTDPLVEYSDSTIEGACPQEYTITRTWTATDDCGNSTVCVQTIVIDDSVAPVVTCPADITIDCEESTSPDNTGFASATDNCDTDLPEITYTDVTIEDFCPEVIERTWSVSDACGNVGTCVQTITRDDTTPPMIICPEDVTVDCATDVPPVLTGGVTVSDNCGFVTVTHDGDFVSDSTCLNQYTLSRVYRATDECGNTATCTQTIEVDDQTPPEVACPADITVDCAEDVPAPDPGSVSATDNCEGEVVITHIGDVTVSETCLNQFVVIRTYAATDACGNSTLCDQMITVFDDIAPSITCPPDVEVECAEDVPPVDTGAPVVSDNCAGPITVGWLGDVISNQTCPHSFTVTRTYQATDACGNSATCVQIITVDDQTAPEIECPPNLTITFGDSESPDNTGQPTGTDNCGDVEPSYTFEDEIIPGPCDEEYTIIRLWTATDECGNTATCEQEIFVDGDCIVDLALTKVLLSDFEVDGGDNLLFQITVLNEGEVTISSLEITDYIPLGFSLNDPNWTPGNAGSTGQSASIVLSIANGGLDANGLNPGEFVNVTINLLADLDVAPGYYFNCAEILNMFDLQGNDISDEDIDSTPDDDDTNDLPGEDDFDCAPICVLPDVIISGDGYVCPEEIVTYTVNDYNPDFTYDWTLSGGGVIIADNGSDIDIQWQEEPGGPFQITLTVTLGDGCSVSAIYFVYIQGVETIACNDHIQISLGDSCETVLLSGIILEGENEGNNNYYVVITDEFGNEIPDATLTSEHIGGTFNVMVLNECNGQSCWGTVSVEDKIPPVIACTDVTVSCGTSLEPVYAPPVTGTVSETIFPNLPIGPNGGTITTAELILDVPSNAVVTDVNVTVDLNHTWVGDLDVVLVSPSGTQVLLADQLCGSVDNWDNVEFDDEAGLAVTAACNPIPPALAGSVIPQGVLATIDGQSAVGTWTLIVTDNVGGDGGTLNQVTLDVEYYLAVPSAPFAFDACGEVDLTYTEVESGDPCENLTLTRLWTATDGSGNSATCVQTITITPLTLDNVEFPMAYEGDCGESIHPNNTGWPSVDGTPITDETDLCNIFVGYWDKELNDCGGGRKIARTWTVLDWCNVELVEAVQVIKLSDNVGPELTCPDDMEVGTDFWYCYANVSVPKPEAIDECSEIATYSLVSSSGVVVSFGNNFVINGLEVGTHTATWTVTDECGNSSTCSFQITVVDDVVPVANCDSHTTVSLTNDGPHGVTLVPADVFDDGSYDNCGPVTFRARRMDSCIDFDWTTEGACIDDTPGGIPPVNSRDRGTVHRPCVPFACCDVGAGPIMVELEVTDAAGNVNYCMVEATVQDKISPFIECPPNDIIVSCDFWFNVQEGTFVDGEGNNDGSLDEDPLSAVFGNMYDAFRYDESVRKNVIINDPDGLGANYNWGLEGWADDNCEVNLSVRVRVVDDCSGGDLPGSAPDGAIKYIERRFSASDGNVGVAPGTCTQRIWVVDFEPFYITDVNCNNQNPQDGVIWPCDVLLTSCPEDLGNTGEPVIFDDACSLIGVTYEDTRFDFVDGACFKILRRWSVIDWCQYDSQTGAGLWNYTQVIKVHDEDGPEFVEPCETEVLCVADEGVSLPDNNQAFLGEDDPLSSSCSVHLNLSRVVHETCSDQVSYDVKIYPYNGTDFILVQPTRTVAVDSNNDATLSFDTRQSTIQDIRLNGLPYNSEFCGDYHRILWSVEDGCGNWSHCEYLFRLEDCKQPSPVCINGLSTVVMPIGGEVTIWAKDFNASSFDDCTPSEELLYSFTGDVYTPSMTYNCDNVPAFNVELSTQIWVADGGTDDNCNGTIQWSERNKDFCTTTIVITDNNNACNGDGSILAGEIFTDHEEAVELVGVTLTSPGQHFPTYVTAQNGKFSFSAVPFGEDYVITPERNDEHRNGVSTLDLVRIQKHLLGKEPFTSPYQYIAADANNSEGISAIDLVEIRKLILGLYTEFPENTSWRFVEKGYDMDSEHPWPFSENIELLELTDDSLMYNDFVGVKVGDVNNTVKANADQILPRGGNRVLRVTLDAERFVEAGDVIDVRLMIPEYVEGFQWTLETEGLTFAGVESSERMPINDSHVGVLNDGIVTMSWNADGQVASDEAQVVTLQFVANTSGQVAHMIHMTSLVTEAEAYTVSGEILDVKLGYRTDAAAFALYQNTPNPWNDETSIGFDLPEDASVTLTVFDATGKVVKTVEGEFVAGYNTIILNAKDLPGAGVMYYRLESGTYSASKKMVLVK